MIIKAILHEQEKQKQHKQYYCGFYQTFRESLAKAKKKSERDIIITVFRDASINNPLFNDMDKELILAYYNNENYLTQFSLDTNWVKALEAVRKE